MKFSYFSIIGVYVIVSLIWIGFSDILLHVFVPEHLTESFILHLGKGALFVVITGVLLNILIKKKEQRIKASESQFKSVFLSNTTPLWIYDKQTLKFVEVNNAAIATYGYSRDEFLSMSILDIRPPGERARLLASVKDAPYSFYSSGWWQHTRKSGEIFIVSISCHSIVFAGADCEMVMAIDVTEKVEQEAKLRSAYENERRLTEELERNMKIAKQSQEENRRLAEVVKKVNSMVVITDVSGVIQWVNDAFCQFTEFKKEEIIGKDTLFLHGPETDTRMQVEMMSVLRACGGGVFEMLNYTKSGERYWVELNISSIYDSEHRLEGYISIQNVITERKEKESRIKEQNAVLAQLAWMNSHALRKPVASIISLVDLCQEMHSTEELKEMQGLIKKCTVDLDRSIREIGAEINKNQLKEPVIRPDKRNSASA
ncbi:PAS domain S-box protein [Arcticibacter sp. MXS-1]|uniref:PAS domain S-box protein n=1 Tax=Arcticibacter sp. MXS-1 TaxID=3341726 RepID=UPI0035A862CE